MGLDCIAYETIDIFELSDVYLYRYSLFNVRKATYE